MLKVNRKMFLLSSPGPKPLVPKPPRELKREDLKRELKREIKREIHRESLEEKAQKRVHKRAWEGESLADL